MEMYRMFIGSSFFWNFFGGAVYPGSYCCKSNTKQKSVCYSLKPFREDDAIYYWKGTESVYWVHTIWFPEKHSKENFPWTRLPRKLERTWRLKRKKKTEKFFLVEKRIYITARHKQSQAKGMHEVPNAKINSKKKRETIEEDERKLSVSKSHNQKGQLTQIYIATTKLIETQPNYFPFLQQDDNFFSNNASKSIRTYWNKRKEKKCRVQTKTRN